jgi:hypothetical protein
MIGGAAPRRAGTAIVIALIVGLGLGLRSADPSRADPLAAAARLQRLAAAATAVDDALAQLSSVLTGALDHARRGAALTVAGDLAPAPELTSAAAQLRAGADTADAVRRALAALAGTAASVAPGREVPALPYSGPELLLMAAQLNVSAQAATLFVERRHASEAVVSALGDAVAALERDQPAAALRSLDTATAPLALLEDWHDRPALVGYWMTIAGNLLDAARGIATATIDGDPSAAQAAAARYAAASKTARGADNALAVSIAEEGSSISSIPLRRLAVAAGEAVDLRSALRGLMHPGS